MQFPSVFNFRDVGGMAASDGTRVRTGLLYRSGDLGTVAEDDAQAMVARHGLRLYCDFRTRREVHRDGEPGALKRAGVAWRRMPLDPVDEVFVRIRRPTDADWTRFYLSLLDRHRQTIASILELIAEAPGPMVMGCSAGKDRTGIITALVLELLGVPRPLIIEEYARTTAGMAAHHSRFEHLWRDGARDRDEVVRHFLTAAPEIMAGFLDGVDQQFGGAESVMRGAGLTDAALTALRARLLTPVR